MGLTVNKPVESGSRDRLENFSTTVLIHIQRVWFPFVFTRYLVVASRTQWNRCGFTMPCWWFCLIFTFHIGKNTTLVYSICHGWVEVIFNRAHLIKISEHLQGYDLGMWGSVTIYAVNYVFGTGIWKIPLFGSNLSCGHFIEVFLYVGAMSNLPMVFYNLYRSYADKSGKMRNFVECMRPLVPLILFLGVSCVWVHKSPNKIVETDPRAV